MQMYILLLPMELFPQSGFALDIRIQQPEMQILGSQYGNMEPNSAVSVFQEI